jgi:secreted PhoX family phosphatase
MYVATTTDDLVLRIELNGEEAYVSNFVDDANTPGLDDPDNLALDNQGNLWVIEDNAPSDIFIAHVDRANERRATRVERFASLSDCAAESTGLYFDRNGKTAWVHVQHAGGALRNDLMVEFTR